ncbi:biotin transporter BioY [Candidatus Tisiphia endosymbiont of Nemotelus uliginosus]|uniref:biotin transporter BioY n=1 Tax=Candidatus Tisiphia endosymbiont of Nemotelus uliginosus TaxID=3077926 RepID=UPI0035C8CDFE
MSLNIPAFRTATPLILEIFFGVSLLAICAQITIPLTPVPITMQTVAVLFIGLVYNKVNAPLTVLAYLILGSIGVPIFSQFSGGMIGIIGPRGGYLVGFLIAVYVMTLLKGTIVNNKLIEQLCLCLIGNVIIMGLGYLWLAKFLGITQAFYAGVLPFIIPGIIKSILLIGLIRIVKPPRYS